MKRLVRQKYTLEFKLEAGRLVQGGVRPAAAARQLGITENTLLNWRNAERDGRLVPGSAAKVAPEQMEMSCVRAENARLKMELEILKKKPRRTLPRSRCEVRLDRE